jgi:16S rRNA (uracil1498-N3)-methyltransferase
MAAGDLVEAIDGHGRLYRAELAWFHGAAHHVAIEVIAEAEVQPDCVVVAALIKQHRWEWLLEKCCELGATHIVPLQAERSMVRVEERADAKIERWQRICDETAKQCERLDPPRVEAPATLEKALAARSSHRWLEFDESQRLGEWSTLDVTGPLVIVVGPEGGLTEREKQRIRSAGATTLGLGRHLLRAETAVTAALAAIRLRRDGLL